MISDIIQMIAILFVWGREALVCGTFQCCLGFRFFPLFFFLLGGRHCFFLVRKFLHLVPAGLGSWVVLLLPRFFMLAAGAILHCYFSCKNYIFHSTVYLPHNSHMLT
jgi:hypothetical protein